MLLFFQYFSRWGGGLMFKVYPINIVYCPIPHLENILNDTFLLIAWIYNTVIIMEHRIEDVLRMGVDWIIVMNNGEIIADTSSDEILHTDLFVFTTHPSRFASSLN